MRKDEPRRLVERQQSFLVFEDEVVCGDVVAFSFAICFGVDRSSLVDRKIALVRVFDVDRFEIFDIGRFVYAVVFVEDGVILFFEHDAEIAEQLVALLVVLAIVFDFVDEEQRQTLDPLIEKLFLLLEMRADGLADLNAAHIRLVDISDRLVRLERYTVEEDKLVAYGVDLLDDIPVLILVDGLIFASSRQCVKVVVDVHGARFSLYPRRMSYLKNYSRLGRLVVIELDVGKIDKPLSALEVAQFKAFDLDLFYKLFLICVQCVEHIDEIVRLLVRGGIVERKQRFEPLDPLGRRVTAQLLRFVQDDDGAIRGDDVDGTARREVVLFAIDYARRVIARSLFHRRRKRLRVDDHDIELFVGRKVVQFIEVFAVVDKVARLFAILFEEVVFRHLERLEHALADSDRRHDNDEFAPSVTLV